MGIFLLTISISTVALDIKPNVGNNRTFTTLARSLGLVLTLCTFFSIAGLSGDRLLAVTYPMIYQRENNKCILIYGMLCATIIFVMMSIKILFADAIYMILGSVICVITGIFVCIANLLVRKTVKKKFHQIGDRQVTVITEEQKAMELKKTRICVVLAFSFLIFWIPNVVIDILSIIYSADEFSSVQDLGILIAMLNSNFDPVFYIIRSQKLRNEIKECICQLPVQQSN